MAASVLAVDEYIAGQTEPVQAILREIRRVVHEAVPAAGETISYHIPAFTLGGRTLMHVGAWKRHIAVYPVPDPGERLTAAELAPYLSGRGTLRFPLSQPVPGELIGRIAAALASQRGT